MPKTFWRKIDFLKQVPQSQERIRIHQIIPKPFKRRKMIENRIAIHFILNVLQTWNSVQLFLTLRKLQFLNIYLKNQMKYLISISVLLILSLSNIFNFESKRSHLTFRWFPRDSSRRLWDIICPKVSAFIDVKYIVPEGEGLDSIRQCLYPWFKNPIGKDLKQYEKTISKSQFYQREKLCTYQQLEFSYPSNIIFNYDQSPNVIFPGGLVQGKNVVTGSEQYKSIPFSNYHKKPIGIYTPGENPIQSNPRAADVHRTIKKYLSKIELSSAPVYVQIAKSDEMNRIFVDLKFNRKIIEKLGLAPTSGDPEEKRNKILVFIAQGVAQLYPTIQSQKGPADPIAAFLSPQIGEKQCSQFKKVGWWGPNNIPCYVEKVTYGRFIAASVDETPKTLQLYNLGNSFLNNGEVRDKINQIFGGIGKSSIFDEIRGKVSSIFGPSVQDRASAEIRKKINEIFSQASLNIFSIGSDKQCTLSQIKNNEWQECFGELQKSATSLNPVQFQLKDFNGNEVKVSNKFTYYKRTCEEQTN